MTTSQGRLLGGPATVHRERLAADLLSGIRAQEYRKGARLLRRDELMRGLLFGQELEFRLRYFYPFTGCARIDLLLNQRGQHPSGADSVCRSRRSSPSPARSLS